MMNNSEQIRKKVYVETTVVSDATALPTSVPLSQTVLFM